MNTIIQAPYTLKFAQDDEQLFCFQRYIQTEYNRAFDATIPHFLPYLLGMFRADGALVGAFGLNLASINSLYLEHYLDDTIENSISHKIGKRVLRSNIVEIGNFACAGPGNARIMFAAICRLLYENHINYVVFTGTSKLRNVFHRLNLEPLELVPALAECVGEDALAWGKYYQNHPYVMVGDLNQGRDTLSKTSLLLSLFTPMPVLPTVQMRGQL
ncbi:thermostable hemolysin [Pragia fontium]|uniref:thermostable hemolysin n=1 Tax=Pragia fontium TaxID=82985 RepID=UPI00064A3F5B|nr:thermostable hemolysin [Pragia fontium]AKJ41691.1 thermostable hemolysin [Pragia fontium]